MQLNFVTVDVFTDRRFGGNPLAVVLDGRGLATQQMQSIAAEFNTLKLAPNTHLYTSNEVIDDFPGRVFKIGDFVKPDKKLRTSFIAGHANILLRNYPISVEELKKKTGLKEGGEHYLIGCGGVKEKWMFTATRIR